MKMIEQKINDLDHFSISKFISDKNIHSLRGMSDLLKESGIVPGWLISDSDPSKQKIKFPFVVGGKEI